MTWDHIFALEPLSMLHVLAYMERWRPGSTASFRPAATEQIAALASFYGGADMLPPLYLEFLQVMGEERGELDLWWNSTAISDLLEELEAGERQRADPSRYLKIALGSDDYNGRHPDDFLDLQHPTPDGRDAAFMRAHERYLVRDSKTFERPFATFSDLLRSATVARWGFCIDTEEYPAYFSFGDAADSIRRLYAFLVDRLGFESTELGASSSMIPLEHHERGAIALVLGPSGTIPTTGLKIRARDPSQHRLLEELLADYKQQIIEP